MRQETESHRVGRRLSVVLLRMLLPASLMILGCHYYAKPSGPLSDSCRADCANLHSRCVESGQARQFDLPGITYHLCARELEQCRSNCAKALPEADK